MAQDASNPYSERVANACAGLGLNPSEAPYAFCKMSLEDASLPWRRPAPSTLRVVFVPATAIASVRLLLRIACSIARKVPRTSRPPRPLLPPKIQAVSISGATRGHRCHAPAPTRPRSGVARIFELCQQSEHHPRQLQYGRERLSVQVVARVHANCPAPVSESLWPFCNITTLGWSRTTPNSLKIFLILARGASHGGHIFPRHPLLFPPKSASKKVPRSRKADKIN